MLTTIKPKKKTLILYLLVPVLMFVFTVFVPLVTARMEGRSDENIQRTCKL